MVLPELAVTGYPPEDLLLRPRFIDRAREALDAVAEVVTEGVAVVGFPEHDGDVYNAAAVIGQGSVQRVYRKRFLPNYGVFDEMRYFAAGSGPMVIEALGVRIGVAICEDIWYPAPLSGEMAAAAVDLLVCPAASPFHRTKGAWRERMLATRARDIGCAVGFCNLVGGQDELVFDGRSTVVDSAGEVLARAPEFAPGLAVADLPVIDGTRNRLREPRGRRVDRALIPQTVTVEASPPRTPGPDVPPPEPALDDEAVLWRAIVCGIRDYSGKNGMADVLIGLSGGIDSALTAALAVDALGPAHVTGVAMPSSFSSSQSLADATTLADALGIQLIELPIGGPVVALDELLEEQFAGTPRGVAEENIQARLRGLLLMALSNKFGALVLATGNKSEAAVGYATLYGDMAGGLSPIKDLSKTWVYRLARFHNREHGREVIPEATIERPPTAELSPDQRDTDNLPPYDELDPILEAYIEEGLSLEEVVVATGATRETVAGVIALVDGSEYKRRQGAIGIKLSARAFGRDRRMPITHRDVP